MTGAYPVRPLLLALALLCVLAPRAAAQETVVLPPSATTGAAEMTYPEPRPLHVTDYLTERPEAQASLREFHTRREIDGDRPLELDARAEAYRTGDTRAFSTFNFQNDEREELDFTLVETGGDVRIWVENEELDTVSSDDLEALGRALAERTPEGSHAPERGILDLSQSIFGRPPDAGGDGRLDVLLLDIQDNYDPEDTPQFVAGFVDPADLTDRGNERDILYLDLRPGLVHPDGTRRGIENLESTAAHEYQHLIHMNYDRREVSFVNEGLSEWSEVLHGYPRRPMGYLSQSDAYNIELLRWRPQGTSEVIQDYERAGLFTTYLSERLGTETTGSITRDEEVGTRGYRNAASEIDEHFQELLLDFHAANFINDEQAGPGLGYQTRTFDEVRARPARRTDGRTATSYDGRAPLQPGGVQYLMWNDVEDFSVALDGTAPLRARALLYRNGMITAQEMPVGIGETTLPGDYDRLVLVLAHTNPDADPLTAHFEALWTAEEFFHPEELTYDEGEAERYVGGRGMELLTRFTNPFPSEGFLASLELPIYFLSQFTNPDAPEPDAPRAFTLVIREVGDDGAPGEELFTLTQEDPRPYWRVSGQAIEFLDIDLTDHREELAALPETVYVGYRDVPDTENEVAFPSVAYAAENVSYVGEEDGWQRLWDFVIEREDEDDLSLDETAIPVRATFFRPTDEPLALEDDPLPPQIALSPNAPNPFTSTSQMHYTLPEDMDVRLEVYDVTGRRLALLREGGQLAGEHRFTLDARDWSSGVYVVTLTAEGERVSQPVVVVR